MSKTNMIDISEIKIQDLNPQCLLLASKFSRVLKAKHGTILRLQDDRALSLVAAYARATEDAELKILSARIEREVQKHLESQGNVLRRDSAFFAEASSVSH